MAGVGFLAAAREEFLAAAVRYESAAAGLGQEFVQEVERALARLAEFPDQGSPHLSGSRRLVLRRFPFEVVYLTEPGEVIVVAVAHLRRSPGYWRTRL